MAFCAIIALLLGLDFPDLGSIPPSGTNTNPPPTFYLTLAFDAVPGASGYQVWVTPVSPRRTVTVSTNFFTTTTTNRIHGLLSGQVYWLNAQTIAGTNSSDLSPELVWPPTLITYDPITIQTSPDLTNWSTLPGVGMVLTNPTGGPVFYRMQAARTNNIDPYQTKE